MVCALSYSRGPPSDEPEGLEVAQLLREVLRLPLHVVEGAVADEELLRGLGDLRSVVHGTLMEKC